MKSHFQKGTIRPLITLVITLVILAVVYYVIQQSSTDGVSVKSTNNLTATSTASSSSTAPTVDISQYNGKPYILYMSAIKGSIGTTVELRGVNLIDRQGNQNLVIENSKGQTASFGYGNPEGITDARGWTIMKFTITDKVCTNIVTDKEGSCTKDWLQLTPGDYQLYVTGIRGSTSDAIATTNKVKFTITN